MMAFGDVVVDNFGPVRDTPSVSAVSGLLANALGFQREETTRLSQLQDRLVLACRLDHVASRFTDFQTALLGAGDRWWTTSGSVVDRAGSPNTFNSPHIREREFDGDVRMTLLVRLRDADCAPTLDDIAQALEWPARPIFLGRKCCLPSAPIFGGFVEADSAFAAMHRVPFTAMPVRDVVTDDVTVTLPMEEPMPERFQRVVSTERRDWPAGVHAGEQGRFRGTLLRDAVAKGFAT